MLLIIIAVVITGIGGAGYLFMQRPEFGRLPEGERLERIKASPNYREEKFQNQHSTPDLTEGAGFVSILRDFIFKRSKRSIPSVPFPSRKTNLFELRKEEDVLIWFGHSSYFIQTDGKKILVDPVLSGSASPLKFTTSSYTGSDIYTPDDIPEIDYLLLTHDHWDHLDYDTILKLKPKIKRIITGLGTGAHLEYWGFDTGIVNEKDWNEEVILEDGFAVHTCPARHFSGRGFKRQQSLWMSYVLQTRTKKIYIGGDSGYDSHFAEIGEKFGPFDLAILECGQYNKSWKYIHMMPEEVVKAGADLQAKALLPVHWAKFSLALHSWDEPIMRLKGQPVVQNLTLVHPMIGEKLVLTNITTTKEWWKEIQ